MKKGLLQNILGGQILAGGAFSRHWKFILYIFTLVILYISIHFGIRNTMQRMISNEDTLRNLRSEYMGKYTRLLYTGKRGEIEQLLQDNSLDLTAPVNPPVRVKIEED